jgi:ABC-type glycerol-3-phosphate transport system substrate-binding protein
MKINKLGRVSTLVIVGLLTLSLLPAGLLAQSGAEKPYKGIELTVPVQALPSLQYVMKETPNFTEETGIIVKYVIYPELELRDKITMDLATGAGTFNVVGIDNMYVPEYVENDWIVALDPYLQPEYEVTDIYKKYRETNAWKGNLYAIGLYGETTLLYYRKDWFAEAGMAPPSTMDELLKAAKYFTNPPERYGIALRGLRGEGMNVYIWTGFLRAFGGKFFDENWEPVFNSQEAVQATKFYKDLVVNYSPPGCSSFSWSEVETAFEMGQIAMMIDASDMAFRVEDPEKSVIVGKAGYAPVPAGPAGRFPSIYTFGSAISKVGSKPGPEREAAAQWLQWATSKEMEWKKATDWGIVSVTRESVLSNHPFFKEHSDYADAFNTDIEVALPDYRPRIPEWRKFGDILGIYLEKIFAGELSVEVGLGKAVKETRDILVGSGRLKG